MPLMQTAGRDMLECRRCGETFPEARATDDGWHYACPSGDCEARGIGEGLRRLED